MLHLSGKNCFLRALEPEDLQFLYEVENDEGIWEISGTLTPYSKVVLKKYLSNAHRDIFEVKQLRLCICGSDEARLGLVDLFDFDPKNNRAGLGIVISNAENRNKGIGEEAVRLVLAYVFSTLGLHQVYVNILEENSASRHLFEKLGFEKIGVKKDWVRWGNHYKNEIIYQKIQP
ncbi:MAG: GNAT family N-acetyltransferase [Bacteroidota bacterium]